MRQVWGLRRMRRLAWRVWAMALWGSVWLGLGSPSGQAQDSPTPPPPPPWEAHRIALSAEEVAWLQAHPHLRVGMDPAWPPFSVVNNAGEMEGIDVDFLQVLQARLGITVQIKRYTNWPETYQRLLQGELDMVTGIALTPSRQEQVRFTEPYVQYPVGIIMRKEEPFLTSLSGLRDRILALPRRHATTEYIRRDYPELQIIETNTAEDMLALLARHKSDAAVLNLVTASHIIKTRGFANLKITGLTDYRFDQRFATRQDLPLLQAIMNKALASISTDLRYRLLDRWVLLQLPPSTPWQQIALGALAVLGLAGAFVLVIGRANRRLAQELAERQQIEEALRSSNEDKSHLLSMVAHDLNNPISAVMMATDLLRDELPAPTTTTSHLLTQIENSGLRMMRLLRNLLSRKAIEEGTACRYLETLDLYPLLSNTVERLRSLAVGKHITLHCELGKPPCLVYADSDATEQIIENLLSNALKFSLPATQVVVRLTQDDTHAFIRIQDEGPGIAPEEMPKLFTKFARLSARPTGQETSHGLGLSIVKQLAEAMHATVTCESEVGHGATFIVAFPR